LYKVDLDCNSKIKNVPDSCSALGSADNTINKPYTDSAPIELEEYLARLCQGVYKQGNFFNLMKPTFSQIKE